MDYATIVGIIAGFLVVALAIFLGGSALTFVNVPSLLIVLGGTIAATLIRYPFSVVMGALMTGVSLGFGNKDVPLRELHQEIVDAARVAKMQGVMHLEQMTPSHDFLAKGLLMVSDDSPADQIRAQMENERDLEVERLKNGEKIFRAMGDSAPAFGMIGTLIGLVQMLSTLSDPDAIGPAMAVALLTTLYGALISNVICLPMADKMVIKVTGDDLSRTMILEGVVQIGERKHPDIISEYLLAYLPQGNRDGAGEAGEAAPAAA